MKLKSEEIVITGVARLFQWIPQLQREDRKTLLHNFEASATWSSDFVIMMGLSTALAALGLLQNSTAVVIGAMLVAPLMTPLIGAGFAMVQGNVKLFKSSIQAMSYGVFVGFSISLLIGIFTPGHHSLTEEIVSRGEANILDLAVALFSGMAAAYATARPNVAATLAGVAIAAALVPPLAVIGLSVAYNDFHMAGMASVLLIINLVAIIMGAAFVFQMMGVKGSRNQRSPLWARRIMLSLVVFVGLLVLPLGHQSFTQRQIGQSRPLLFPASLPVRDAVKEYIETVPEVRLLLVARSGLQPDLGVGVIVASKSQISTDVRDNITKIIRQKRGEKIYVPIFALQENWIDGEDPTKTAPQQIPDQPKVKN